MRLPSLPSRPVKVQQARSTSFLSYTTVTASATPHTKGNYAQLVASTNFDVDFIHLYVSAIALSANDKRALMDIAIGPAGQEVVIIANLNVGWATGYTTTSDTGRQLTLPLKIPSGTRIAARLQSNTASQTAATAIDLFGGNPYSGLSGFTAVDTYGADTANSRGTAISSGNATKGAWVELAASTAKQINALFCMAGLHSGTAVGSRNNIIDIGAGAAGSEVVLIADVPMSYFTTEALSEPARTSMLLGVDLPAGVRLAARAAGSGAAVNIDVAAYGLRR